MNDDEIKDNPYLQQMQQLGQRLEQQANDMVIDLASEQNPTKLNEASVTVDRKWSPGQYRNSNGHLAVNADDVLKYGYTFLTNQDGKLQLVDKNNGYKVIVPNVQRSPFLTQWIDKNNLWDKAENFTQSSQRATVAHKDAIQQVRDDMRQGGDAAALGLAAVATAPVAAEFALGGFGLGQATNAAQKGTQFLVDRVLPNTNLGTLAETLFTRTTPSLMTQGYKYPLLFANTGWGAAANGAQFSYYTAEGWDQLKHAFNINDGKAAAVANFALAATPFFGIPSKTYKGVYNTAKKAGQWLGENVIPERWTNMRYLFQYGPKKSWNNLTTRLRDKKYSDGYFSKDDEKKILFPDLYKSEQEILHHPEFNKQPEPVYVDMVVPNFEVKFGNTTSNVSGGAVMLQTPENLQNIELKIGEAPYNFLLVKDKPITISTKITRRLYQSRFSNPEIIKAVRNYESSLNKTLNGEGLVTGSTVGVGRGFIQNQVNNDTEIITTAARLNKAKSNIHFQQTGTNGLGDEKGVSEFAQGNTNGVDFDIIQENENGQAVGKLAHQIYSVLHPEEANRLYKANELNEITTYDIPLPVSAEQLFQELRQGDNVAKVHLSDVLFMGANLSAQNPANAKQGYRAYNLLTMPEQQSAIESAILTKGKSLFGSTWKRPSAQITGFDDVEANKKFLQEVINENSAKQYFTENQINEIAKNPKQMQNIFDVYYMNNFYGLRAQGRYSPYVGRDLTNEELLRGFTENIQYGGGTGSGVGQNHTSGGITAFGDNFPFRSVRIGRLSYDDNLTLNEFVDQVKRVTNKNNFGSEYYSDPKSVFNASQSSNLGLWRSMATNRGVGAYGGSYVGMLDIQNDPTKYLIQKGWTPEVGLTFSNKWDIPTIAHTKSNDQVIDRVKLFTSPNYSQEFQELLRNYQSKATEPSTGLYFPSYDVQSAQNILSRQSNTWRNLYLSGIHNTSNLKNNFVNAAIMTPTIGFGLGMLGGLGMVGYRSLKRKLHKGVINEDAQNYATLLKNKNIESLPLQDMFNEANEKSHGHNFKTEDYLKNKLKDQNFTDDEIDVIINYMFDLYAE